MNRDQYRIENNNLIDILKASDLFDSFDEQAFQTLSANLEFICLPEREILFRQGDPGDAMYIVVEGHLAVTQRRKDGGEIKLREIGPGEPIGELQLLTGRRRASTVYTSGYTELVKVPFAVFEKLLRRVPAMLQQIARISRQRLRNDQLLVMLSGLLGPLEDGVLHEIAARGEWVHRKKGEWLLRQGDSCDSLYLLVSGRLRAVVNENDQAKQEGEEFSTGELIGDIAMLACEDHTTGIFAIRDSELVRFSRAVFQQITDQYPEIMKQMAQMLIKRLKKVELNKSPAEKSQNIAVVAIHPGVPLTDFVNRLSHHLNAADPTLHVSSRRLDSLLGDCPGIAQSTGNDYHSIRLSNWLDEQEGRHRFILYEADPFACPWTEHCISRADHILFVAEAGTAPGPGEIEKRYLQKDKNDSTVHRTLILLHPDGSREPAGTREWLAAREVDIHHHIRRDNQDDFSRLGRILSGRAVSLVLGGGGSRGLAHIGVIRALKEAGVPIDMIGGTSMGAIIAAQYAMGYDVPTMLHKNRVAFIERKPFKEYTFPIMSLVRSRRLDDVAQYFCGDRYIEDLWMNFFCVSSNLSDAKVAIHKQGPLGKMARASSSIPGVALPVLENGKLLVDGAFFNNLPSDIMRQFTNGHIIAVKVAAEEDLTLDEKFKEIPSPWQIVWSRLNPFRESIKTPNILDIMMRTMMLGSSYKARSAEKEADWCLSVPVNQFGLLEFTAIDEIVEAGYQYARKEIKKLITEDRLKRLPDGRSPETLRDRFV